MDDKVKAVINNIDKHYRSEFRIHGLAEREYEPSHVDYLYLDDVYRILDDLTNKGILKMIKIPILDERWYKINKDKLK